MSSKSHVPSYRQALYDRLKLLVLIKGTPSAEQAHWHKYALQYDAHLQLVGYSQRQSLRRINANQQCPTRPGPSVTATASKSTGFKFA